MMRDSPLPNLSPPTEKDFIAVFSRVFQIPQKPLLSGSEFDDCAAVRLDSFCRNLFEESLTFSTDSVRASSDFPKQMTSWQRGWMAAAVNLSDLAAMGSKPVAFLFSAGLPAGFTLSEAESLAQGIQDCVSLFGAEVIGGDTEFGGELTITGTVIGLSENRHLVFRRNAKPGDLLCVTGAPGAAGVALSLLLNEFETDFPVSESFFKHLTEPFPRIFEGMLLSKSGAVTSMTDTSDGLASSIYELSSLSGVGFEIDEQNLLQAVDPEASKILEKRLHCGHTQNNGQLERLTDAKTSLLQEALYTGGDYELLFTVSPDRLKDVEEIFQKWNESGAPFPSDFPSAGKPGRYPCRFTVIGKAIAESENVISRQSDSCKKLHPLLKKGYDSFKKYI